MVILQFNKLIRNKWVWGVFAILVSLAFVAPDEWFRGSDDRRSDTESRNRLSGAEFDASLFERCEHLVRDFIPNFQRSPVAQCFDKNSVRDYWKAYAALLTARKAGYSVPDAVLAERVKALFSDGEGGFSDTMYKSEVRRAFGVEPAVFEEQLRLWMTLEGALDGLASAAAWFPPMELDQTNRDFTDKFTVQVATFTEDKADADAVKLDDEGLKKWYDDNVRKLALPERFKLRYIRFNPDASNVLAKVSVSEDDIKSRYDENVEKGMYDVPPATTNDVKTVKPLEDVRAGIEVALRHEAALEWLKNDVKVRTSIDEEDDEAVKGLLPGISGAEGLKIEESDWFALSGGQVAGFMKPVELQFPGVNRREFDRTVRSLIDYHFGVVSSDRAVWLVELADRSEAHTPDFDEAKGSIGDMALRDARLDAFKNKVEAVAKSGVDAVLNSGNVSTNLTFAPCDFGRDYAMGWVNMYGEWDFKSAGFPNAEKVVFAARRLGKGEVSDFVSLGAGRGALVVCNDRKDGDPADFARGERFARMVAMRAQAVSLFGSWLDANLDRLGYKEAPKTAYEEEDEGDVE